MKIKKLIRTAVLAVLGVLALAWAWRWMKAQGGIVRVLDRQFPGMGIDRIAPADPRAVTVDRADPAAGLVVPPTARAPIRQEVEEAAPTNVKPQVFPPTVVTTPTEPRPFVPVPGISLQDRLPWENNRKRGEVIASLQADIARVQRQPRAIADTYTEVARVGGLDNYLSMQRDRLNRAKIFPSFPTVTRVAATPPVIRLPYTGVTPIPPVTRLPFTGVTPIPPVTRLPFTGVTPIPPITRLPFTGVTPTPPASPLTPVQEVTGRWGAPIQEIPVQPTPVIRGGGALARQEFGQVYFQE